MMPLQRARAAENRVRNKLSNGPLRVQSNGEPAFQSILQRVGIRQLPGICWYPAKGHGGSRECKVAPRINFDLFVLDRIFFCQDVFVCSFGRTSEELFFFQEVPL